MLSSRPLMTTATRRSRWRRDWSTSHCLPQGLQRRLGLPYSEHGHPRSTSNNSSAALRGRQPLDEPDPSSVWCGWRRTRLASCRPENRSCEPTSHGHGDAGGGASRCRPQPLRYSYAPEPSASGRHGRGAGSTGGRSYRPTRSIAASIQQQATDDEERAEEVCSSSIRSCPAHGEYGTAREDRHGADKRDDVAWPGVGHCGSVRSSDPSVEARIKTSLNFEGGPDEGGVVGSG